VSAAPSLGRLEPGRCVEQDRLEEEQDPPDLVLDQRSQTPDRLRLPPEGEHLAQLVLQDSPLPSTDPRIAVSFHRAPDGLRRDAG
jgi:hypothetical protein